MAKIKKKNLKWLIIGLVLLALIIGAFLYFKYYATGSVIVKSTGCVDSDGDDIYTKGAVTYTTKSGTKTTTVVKDDACNYPSLNSLTEWTCDGIGRAVYKSVVCDCNGDGACN